MTRLVTQAEFARMHGVSEPAVAKWKKRGWLVLQGSAIDADASAASLKKYRDTTDSRAARSKKSGLNQTEVKTTKPAKPVKSVKPVKETPPPAADGGDDELFLPGESAEDAADRLLSSLDIDPRTTTIEEARRIKEVYQALLNRLTFEEKDRSVIRLDLARTVLFECARAARDAWLNWPARVAPLIAADLGVEADRMTEILTEHVHSQIASLGEPEGDFSES
ncbi:hypothetical protein ABLT15_26745 [Paraburkholderia tropica]|uniref:hypothetical protein n=1 Tax=Paraburkholderia tropica TaxID=92647 RepID=UPI0032B61885